ncbi:hypothetical protein FHX51_000371 [Aeriscardovia aeriphila]|nr:hypothetical protein [Aeriscardovia aeriphila]
MSEHAAERRVGQHLKTLPCKKHTGAWITLTVLMLLLIALGVWGVSHLPSSPLRYGARAECDDTSKEDH